MKKSIFLFFLFFLININIFSNELMAFNIKNINVIDIKGQYIDLTISSYDGKNIVLNQITNKKKLIIKTNIIRDTLQYNLNNERKNSFFKIKTKFNLLIPKNTHFEYLIKTTNSSISINKIHGEVSINNTKGEINIDNLVGDLSLINSNKDINLSNIIGDIFVKSYLSQVTTINTLGTLSIQTNSKEINIRNADKIGDISTSNAPISAEFQNVVSNSKIITSNHNLTIKIPEDHNFNFSIFGDLIRIQNEFLQLKIKKYLILGTSNGTIKIQKK